MNEKKGEKNSNSDFVRLVRSRFASMIGKRKEKNPILETDVELDLTVVGGMYCET